MPLFFIDASSYLIPLHLQCLPSSLMPPLFFNLFLLLWCLFSSLMALFFIDGSSLLQCLYSSSMPPFFLMPLVFFDASFPLWCLYSSSMPLFLFDASSSMNLLCSYLLIFSAHCVTPGRLRTMSVCALLREEKPAMHWQRGKKYLHYKELCLNLGQHLFNWVLFRNISQEWPFKSWAVFTFLNFTSLYIKNKDSFLLSKEAIGVFVLYKKQGR